MEGKTQRQYEAGSLGSFGQATGPGFGRDEPPPRLGAVHIAILGNGFLVQPEYDMHRLGGAEQRPLFARDAAECAEFILNMLKNVL